LFALDTFPNGTWKTRRVARLREGRRPRARRRVYAEAFGFRAGTGLCGRALTWRRPVPCGAKTHVGRARGRGSRVGRRVRVGRMLIAARGRVRPGCLRAPGRV